MNIKLKDMDAVKFNGIDIGAVKFNGEYVWRKGSVVVLRHNVGTFSAFANGAGIKWRYKDNEVMTKSCNFKIDESDNNVYLLFDKELSKFTCNNDNNLLLDLSNLSGKITNTLNLGNCKNITGDLSDLGGKITDTLNLSNRKNITGDLSDLNGKITNYLALSSCTKITGDLSDLGGKITNYLALSSCTKITGIYSGQSYPKTIYLSNTGLSASDMDSTLINFANSSVVNGTFTAANMTRTSASDEAVATLTERGWKITGLSKVEA